MLTQIKLKNFKLFKEETAFPLAKINLLTGINGRGKSSLLQSLLLMRQSIEQDENTNQIFLNGSYVRLGSYEDIMNSEANTSEQPSCEFFFQSKYFDVNFSINYIYKDNIQDNRIADIICELNLHNLLTCEPKPPLADQTDVEHIYNKVIFKTHKRKKNDMDYINDKLHKVYEGFYSWKFEKLFPSMFLGIQGVTVNEYKAFYKPNSDSEKGYFTENALSGEVHFDRIHYISADRIGPKDFYLKENFGKFIHVGAKGEMTANVLSLKKDDPVHDKLYLGEDAETLVQQTEEWLKEIFGDAKFTIDDTSREVIYLLFNTKPTANRYKPSNVGFGYSYILPIIVSGLIAREGEILIVENPEAHLHPRAQSELTKFLAKVAACGVQVFIESHSEHILNALRIVVKEPEIEINHNDVSVLYFHEKENGYFTQIPIKSNGKIELWPEGFFDQTEKDLDKLYD
ncbi:MAG: DUF3696 domain-containing protein [Microscillaceae bacterium]|nr:DUF3696 domain-containing protein [Microscillaceae bacterium]